MKTLNHPNTKVQIPTSFVVMFVLTVLSVLAYQTTNPARMVAGFIILAAISLAAYLAFCLIRFAFTALANRRNTKVQKKPAIKPVTKAQSTSSANVRIAAARRASATRRMPGEEIMEIPAYARKAMNRDFPMSVDKLKQATFTVKTKQAFTF